MLPEERGAVNANSRGQICHFIGREGKKEERTGGSVTVAIEVSTAEGGGGGHSARTATGLQFSSSDRTTCEAKDATQGGVNFSQNFGDTEKIGMERISVSLHRSPIKVLRSGAVANAKIARDLVPANKVSGAIEREDPARLCSKSLRPHAVSTRNRMDRYLMEEVDFQWRHESQRDGEGKVAKFNAVRAIK